MSYKVQAAGFAKKVCSTLLAILLSNNLHFTTAFAQQDATSFKDHSLATAIADCYIKSFPSEGKGTTETERAPHETRPAKLEEATKREVTFNSIFTKSGAYGLVQQKMAPILNEYAWGDLNLFYGTTSQPSYHLMSRINRTITTLGEGALATLLVTPTTNIEELCKRQHIIQNFLANTEQTEQLKHSLRTYQAAEQSVLSLYTPFDPLYTKEYKKYMEDKFYAAEGSANNKSAGYLEIKKRFFRDFLGIQYRFLWPVTPPTIMEINFSNGRLGEKMHGTEITRREFIWKGAIPYYGGWFKWKTITDVEKSYGGDDSKMFGVALVLGELFYTWTAYSGIRNYLEYAAVLRNLALRMADVQAFVVAATEVSERIAASPTLEEVYGTRLTHIRELLAQAKQKTELGNLVHYLQELPYNSWSYFFNNAGKLLASHKLFTEHKDAFADAMYELGELDAFISVATLMQEAQGHCASQAYVFTKFLDRSQKQKPYVKLEAMWNPFLDAKVAVDNSITMDGEAGVRSIILTGPNAGGKSTFLTGVTTSLLLSQTFGIAPAKEAVITPFNKINTYINIADDIAAGKSLFMAEVDRAQKHINTISKLKQDEFSFSIFDEPFSGTNPIEGAAAEYSILESIAEYTNTLNIVATHYPLVMLLEEKAKGKGFVNYKVYITRRDPDKKLNYTYKVIPGKSTQAIAIDILEEQGYDTKLLERAREIIEHPERYRSSF